MLFVVAATRLLQRVRRAHLMVMLAAAVVIVVIGGIVFGVIDHVGIGTGLYWSVTTASTVGYGDVVPHTTAARIVAVAVMVTTIPLVGAVFALLAGMSAATQIRKLLQMGERLPTSPYTLVYGNHPVVVQVLDSLSESGDPVVLVAADRPARLRSEVVFRAGDPTDEEVIRASEPQRANRALIACQSDSDTLIVAVALRTTAADLEVFALSESARVAGALRDLGVSHTLSSTDLLGSALARSLESADAGAVVSQLLGSQRYRIQERPVEAEHAGRRLSDLRGEAGGLVLGVNHGGTVDLGVDSDPVLQPGDALVELVARSQA